MPASATPAPLEEIDAVGAANTREAVRDEQNGSAAGELAHLGEQLGLRPRVERRGRLVENEEAARPEEGAGEREPLPLTDRELVAAEELAPEPGVVAGRQRLDIADQRRRAPPRP